MAATTPRGARTYQNFDPSSEWIREEGSDTLVIDLPGFKKEEVKVVLNAPANLKISGDRIISDNKRSKFEKDLQIPANCDVNGVRAKFESGLLYVIMPKIITPVQPRVQDIPTPELPPSQKPVSEPKPQVPPKTAPEAPPSKNPETRAPPETNPQKPVNEPKPQVPPKTTPEAPPSKKPETQKPEIRAPSEPTPQKPVSEPKPKVPPKTTPEEPPSQKPETRIPSEPTPQKPVSEPKPQVPPKATPEAPPSQKPETRAPPETTPQKPPSQKPVSKPESRPPPSQKPVTQPETIVQKPPAKEQEKVDESAGAEKFTDGESERYETAEDGVDGGATRVKGGSTGGVAAAVSDLAMGLYEPKELMVNAIVGLLVVLALVMYLKYSLWSSTTATD